MVVDAPSREYGSNQHTRKRLDLRSQIGTVVQGRHKKYLCLVPLAALVHVYVGCSIDRYPIVPLEERYVAGSGGSAEGEASTAGNESTAGNGPAGGAGNGPAEAGNGPTAGNDQAGGSGTEDGGSQTGGSRPPRPPVAGADPPPADASTWVPPGEDSATPPPGEDAVAPPPVLDSGGPPPCELRGIYGSRITVEAWWGGRQLGGLVDLVDPGRGTIVLHVIYHLTEVDPDGSISGVAKTCGVELPPFYATILCESYQPVYGTEIWGRPSIPAYPFTGTADCLHPGCTVHIDTLAALLGIDLNDPAGPWPAPTETMSLECPTGTGADCFPDHDDDGYGGLTVTVLTEGAAPPAGICPGYEYQGAPLGADIGAILGWDIPRTDRIHLGMRALVGGDVVIADDCSGGSGMAIADGFESRAISCLNQEGMPSGTGEGLAGAETLCMPEQRQFMDENLPLYHCMKEGDVPDPNLALADNAPSPGPQISIVRLGDFSDDINCEDVRNAAY